MQLLRNKFNKRYAKPVNYKFLLTEIKEDLN